MGAATGTTAGAGAAARAGAATGTAATTGAGTGAGAGLPKRRRINPPNPPGLAGAGAGERRTAAGRAAATCTGVDAGAGLSIQVDGSAMTVEGTGTGAGGTASTTGATAGAGSAGEAAVGADTTGWPLRRRMRNSAAAASKAAGVTGFCTQMAEATSCDWVDSAMPGPPRRPCQASQCWRDSSVSKSKMATSAVSSVEGAKLLRPVLEKKKSSTAWVRGGRERRTTFNRVCSLVASTDYRLKVMNRSIGWGVCLERPKTPQDQPDGNAPWRATSLSAISALPASSRLCW